MKYTKDVLTVTELNKLSAKLLQRELSKVAVTGEISNFTHHGSGHMYFTIKDEHAALPAVMFKGYNQKLKFKPSRGDEITVTGTVTIFEPQGRYQIIVQTMTKSGLGRLEKEFVILKNKLKKEGLFYGKHKKPLPPVPKKIGVITSPTGAAIRDIINIIRRRAGNIELILYPSRVQGPEAAREIVSGIEYFNSNYNDIEVIIAGRGGGSLEDLWPFNEEQVARAIFNSKVPVISAVGHETDVTISDFTADLRAPTPSAAAELVIKDRSVLLDRIDKSENILAGAILQKLKSSKRRYEASVKTSEMRYPERILEIDIQNLDYLSEKLLSSLRSSFDRLKKEFSAVSGQLLVMSPLATLKRGYSVSYLAGSEKIIKEAAGLKSGDKIKNIFYSGEALSVVENIKKGKNDE